MNSDKNTIIDTLKYFVLFSRPLTVKEIKMFAEKNLSEKKIKQILVKEKNVVEQFGYFVWNKRRGEVKKLLIRQEITKAKRKILEKIVYWMKFLPCVRGVFGSGSLALENADKNSDLDVLVITAKNRIYSARFFLAGYLFLIGKRRNNHAQKDKVCLNHFISEDDLEPCDKNIYTAHDYSLLYPIIGQKIFDRFRQKNKIWIKKFIVNYPFTVKTGVIYLSMEKRKPNLLGDVLEWVLKMYQMYKIRKNPEFKLKGARIIMNDNELALHPRPQQGRVLKKLKN